MLDTDPEVEFDAIVRLAAQLCGTPIALISLIDEERQWFKAKVGLDTLETPRDIAFCSHAILRDELMEVPDAGADERFVDNPLRTAAPHVQFYAGIPISGSNGHKLGTLCVIDHKPRKLTQEQRTALVTLARQAERLFELRRVARLHRDATIRVQSAREELRDAASKPDAKIGPPQLRAIAFIAAIFAATIVATYLVDSAVRRSDRGRLDQGAERARHFLEERGRTYSGILRSAAALFQASEYVTPQEFRSFIESLSLARRYPAVAGMRYAQSVDEDELEYFLSAARAENPAFRIHPQSAPGSDHFVTRFVEPLDRNQLTLGHDFGAEPIRRAAALRAFESRAPAMSDRIQLISEPMAGPAFLVFAPIYAPTPFANDAESPRAERAWVSIGLRARDFVDGVTRAAGAEFDLTLLDSTQFETAPLVRSSSANDDPRTLHTSIEIAGQRWMLSVAPSAKFDDAFTRALPWVVFFLGVASTGLAASLSLSAWRTEKRSRTLAWQMTQALRQSEQAFRAVIDGTTDFIFVAAADGKLALINRALCNALGYEERSQLALTVHDLVHPDERASFDVTYKAICAGEHDASRVRTVFITRDGKRVHVDGVFVVERGDEGITVRAIFHDDSERRKMEEELQEANKKLTTMANVDALTGVANRRAFDARIAEEWARSQRNNTPLSIVMIDVDFFKVYNDRYGHLEGDECLRRVGAILRERITRAGDFVARYGGEEFVVLLPTAGSDGAARLAEILRASIEALGIPHVGHPSQRVTISLGVASADRGGVSSPAELVAAADKALYRAKGNGRNRVEVAGVDAP